MTEPSVRIDGKVVPLSRRIGRGGEGDVYVLASDPSIAVKLYTVANLDDRPEKIRALVNAKLSQKESLIAFPISEVHSLSGSFIGFTMRLVDGCKPLHELYAPGARKINFPQADFRFLVRTASNVARAVAAVHRNQCVIRDINHSGILVSSKAVVSLIDADSFQIITERGQFLCKVGVPEYTPPELQGASLAGVKRTTNHDAFGLAVVIFQLLFMGRHPFVGTVRRGDIPPIHENISAKRYVYTDVRNVGMDQPPGTPSIEDFYPPLAKAFDQAFLSEHQRPSAEAWVSVLDNLEKSLVKCTENDLHFIPKDASECAWCEMEHQLGTFLFLPHIPSASITTRPDPGAAHFDIDGIWRTIQAIKTSTNLKLSPNINVSGVNPSDAARKASSSGQTGVNFIGVAVVVLGVLGVFALPSAILLWLVVMGGGYSLAKQKKKVDTKPFESGFIASEQLYQRELESWKKRSGVDDFLKLLSELESAKDDYQLIKRQEAVEVSKQGEQGKETQLNAYLSTFHIHQSNIRGIGPATRLTLASYGIDTAADIRQGHISNVPGVGVKLSEKLLDWRKQLESKFVYRPNLSALDHARIRQARINSEAKASPLRAKLSAGPNNLSSLASRIKQVAVANDATLERAARARQQAITDLEFLGIPIPHVSHGSASPSRLAPTLIRPTTSPNTQALKTQPASKPSSSTQVACPRCGSGMVKRLAKRGRNAGSYFWGCSRYPVCKGTKNI